MVTRPNQGRQRHHRMRFLPAECPRLYLARRNVAAIWRAVLAFVHRAFEVKRITPVQLESVELGP